MRKCDLGQIPMEKELTTVTMLLEEVLYGYAGKN